MTLFEFVLAFSSVISALAIGHLLAGAIHILRRGAIVRFDLFSDRHQHSRHRLAARALDRWRGWSQSTSP